jgi:hypothetical protein
LWYVGLDGSRCSVTIDEAYIIPLLQCKRVTTSHLTNEISYAERVEEKIDLTNHKAIIENKGQRSLVSKEASVHEP